MYCITSLAPNCVMERITEIVHQGGKEMAQEAAGHAASSVGKHRQLNVRVHDPSSILYCLSQAHGMAVPCRAGPPTSVKLV